MKANSFIDILLLFGFPYLLPSIHASFIVKQINTYDNHYNSGSWNYNYSQTTMLCGNCSTTSKCGPYCWSEVISTSSSILNTCGAFSQSPINIVQAQTNPNLEYPQFIVHDSGCEVWTQLGNNHAFEVSFSDSNCTNLQLIYNKVTYNLTQFHFHSPAEHAIGGGIADAELHMVHKSSNGQHLVLGVRMAASLAYNNFLSQFWLAANTGANGQSFANSGMQYSKEYEVETTNPIDPYTDFLPGSRSFYTYSGSLTTYPCTEGITWIVFDEVIPIGYIDLQNIKLAVSMQPNTVTYPSTKEYFNYANNRPVQSINTRLIQKYSDSNNINTTINSISSTNTNSASIASTSASATVDVNSPFAIISILNLILNIIIMSFLIIFFLNFYTKLFPKQLEISLPTVPQEAKRESISAGGSTDDIYNNDKHGAIEMTGNPLKMA